MPSTTATPSKKRGRKSADDIGAHLAWTLRNLEELELLEECPLAALASVRRLADTAYAHSLFPSGMAIRQLVLESIDSVCDELGDIPSYQRECQLLNTVSRGGSVAGFSRSLGLSREHVARTVQQRALKLLSRVLLARMRDIE